MGKSKKGGEFERQISKYLTEWLTGKKTPLAFWRTPGSGSLCTIHEENMGLSGDIRALTQNAKFLTNLFSIECKNGYPSTSFWQHFSDTKGFKIREFWKQACRDAEKSEKIPMLIYRKKGKKPLMGVDPSFIDQFIKPTEVYPYNHTIIRFDKKYELSPMLLCDFHEFFEFVKPDEMRKVCENLMEWMGKNG